MPGNGFIVIDRKITSWKWWGNTYAMSVWLYILMRANWKDGYWAATGEEVKRGSFITSMAKMASELNLNRRTIKHWLNVFKTDGQIDYECTARYTRITVMKYGLYQSLDNYSAQLDAQPSAQPSAQLNAQLNAHNRTKQPVNQETNKPIKNKKSSCRGKASASRFTPPTLNELTDYAHEIGFDSLNAQYFLDYYESKGWMIGKNHMKSWKAAVRTWKTRNQGKEANHAEPERKSEESEYTPEALRRAGFSPIESADDFERVFGVTLTDEERNIGKK